MSANAVVAITCPICECAVRPLDDTPCPECHTCPFCGRRLKKMEEHCTCGRAHDPSWVGALERNYAIRAEDIPRRRRRYAIRKQLAFRKAIGCGLIGGSVMVAAEVSQQQAGEMTFPLSCSWAVVWLGCFYAAALLLQRIFRRMEDRRLAAEFPIVDDKGVHGSP